MPPDKPPRRVRFRLWFKIALVLSVPLILLLLFVWNGKILATQNEVEIAARPLSEDTGPKNAPDEIKILAYNIARGFAYKGGVSFADEEDVEARLMKIAELIKREDPDIVFLSEAMREALHCDVDQVGFLATAAGMPYAAFGENYNVGLPFYRVRGGNAILSKVPIEPESNEDLAGRRPFYVTANNRRVLWCSAEIGGRRVLLGSIHTDSFNPRNNLRQTEQILEYLGDRPAIIAGDFNANPGEPSIELIRASNRFSGAIDGPLTFPATNAEQRLDFILAPPAWELVEARVLESDASDHKPVVSVFRVK